MGHPLHLCERDICGYWICKFILSDRITSALTKDQLEIRTSAVTTQGPVCIITDVKTTITDNIRGSMDASAPRPTRSILILAIAISPSIWMVAWANISDLR